MAGYDKFISKKMFKKKELFAHGYDTTEDGKVRVTIEKVSRRQLKNDEERAELRIYYWAAYYGRGKSINAMIMQRKWSPFMKSFHNQSILVAAIRGSRTKMV